MREDLRFTGDITTVVVSNDSPRWYVSIGVDAGTTPPPNRIDRWYASSKVCSCCGNRRVELALSTRDYRCHECGLVMDRDENAAINIENEAARSADSLNGRRDEVRPGHRVPPAASVKRQLESSGQCVRLEHISADSKDRWIWANTLTMPN